MWFSLYRKVILYIYNFIIFVLCKIKHLYNFKDSSYFQLIQKNKAKKKEKRMRIGRGHKSTELAGRWVCRPRKCWTFGWFPVPHHLTSNQNTISPSESCWWTINHSWGTVMISKQQATKKMTELIRSAKVYLIITMKICIQHYIISTQQ